MPSALEIARRLLGQRRRPPVTRWGRAQRQAKRAAQVVLLAYLTLQAFPQILFAHRTTAGGITVYARQPLPPAATARLVEARRLVDRSELATSDRLERVFVCNSPEIFRLFAPFHSGAFAVSLPLTGHIFVASADFEADLALVARPQYATRPLSGTIAHEITHNLIRRRLGWLGAARLPEWIAEGYPEFIAGSGSFPSAEGDRLLKAGQTDPSPAFRYFRGRRLVAYLTRHQHLDFAALVARAGDEAAVADATRQALQSPTPSP